MRCEIGRGEGLGRHEAIAGSSKSREGEETVGVEGVARGGLRPGRRQWIQRSRAAVCSISPQLSSAFSMLPSTSWRKVA